MYFIFLCDNKSFRQNNLQGNSLLFYLNKSLTIKIYSILSNLKIWYHPKFRIPIMHRQFFRKISQKKKCVESFCNIENNGFHCACRKWYLNNQSPWKLYVILRDVFCVFHSVERCIWPFLNFSWLIALLQDRIQQSLRLDLLVTMSFGYTFCNKN